MSPSRAKEKDGSSHHHPGRAAMLDEDKATTTSSASATFPFPSWSSAASVVSWGSATVTGRNPITSTGNHGDNFTRTINGKTLLALLEETQQALRDLDSSVKRDYETALERCPDLVKDETPLIHFLRTDDYRPPEAARRLAAYWKARRDVFGEERWCLPMTQTGRGALNELDLEFLQSGWCAILPVADRDFLILADISKLSGLVARADTHGWGRDCLYEALDRCFLYLATVSTNAFCQEHGATLIHVANNDKATLHKPRQTQFAMIRTALPFKIRRFIVAQACQAETTVLQSVARVLEYNSSPIRGPCTTLAKVATSASATTSSSPSSSTPPPSIPGIQHVFADSATNTLRRMISVLGLDRDFVPVDFGGNLCMRSYARWFCSTQCEIDHNRFATPSAFLSLPMSTTMVTNIQGDAGFNHEVEDDEEDDDDDEDAMAVVVGTSAKKKPSNADEHPMTHYLIPNLIGTTITTSHVPVAKQGTTLTITEIPDDTESLSDAPLEPESEAPTCRKRNLELEVCKKSTQKQMEESDHLSDSTHTKRQKQSPFPVHRIGVATTTSDSPTKGKHKNLINERPRTDRKRQAKEPLVKRRVDESESSEEFLKRRNALYSRRLYHKRKQVLDTLNQDVQDWEERNAALRQDNSRLESLLQEAQRIAATIAAQQQSTREESLLDSTLGTFSRVNEGIAGLGRPAAAAQSLDRSTFLDVPNWTRASGTGVSSFSNDHLSINQSALNGIQMNSSSLPEELLTAVLHQQLLKQQQEQREQERLNQQRQLEILALREQLSSLAGQQEQISATTLFSSQPRQISTLPLPVLQGHQPPQLQPPSLRHETGTHRTLSDETMSHQAVGSMLDPDGNAALELLLRNTPSWRWR